MAITNFVNGLAIDGRQIPTFAAITVGTEDTNVVNVAIQLYADAAGQVELANTGIVQVWISDAATGIGLAATAPDGGFAIGTDGDILAAVVAGKYAIVQSEADGDIDINVTESGTDTFYVAVLLPTGRLVVSGALSFAA